MKKTFDRTPPRAKNFLIAGVVTDEMKKQLDEMHVERVFPLSDTLNVEEKWVEFVNDIFHHTLRLLDDPYRSG